MNIPHHSTACKEESDYFADYFPADFDTFKTIEQFDFSNRFVTGSGEKMTRLSPDHHCAFMIWKM